MELTTLFDRLMNKAPLTQVDVTEFLREMRRTTSGTVITSKLLAEKFHSTEAQAIHAFDVLEACLSSETEGSIEFKTEVGRFRFLNEIIRILSPKYMGDSTPAAVKERAVKFLEDAVGTKRKQWYPSEHSKIDAVYESLVVGDVIKKISKVTTEADEEVELQKNIFERKENAKILQKLLHSQDASDIQAANRLIKNLVEEESRRIERRAELHSLIDRIDTSTNLLEEMLSQSQIDREIVEELADNCQSYRQRLGGVATETSDETTSLLQASANLENVLALYEERKKSNFANIEEPAKLPEKPQLSLVDELLLQLDLGSAQEELVTTSGTSRCISELLHDNCGHNNNLLNLDIDLSNPIGIVETKKSPPNPLDEIERLSRELMDQSLGVCASEFNKKPDKTPLSHLQRSSTKANASKPLLPSPLIESSQNNHPNSPAADLMMDFGIFHPVDIDFDSSKTTKNILLDFNQKPKLSGQPESSPLELRKILNSVKDVDLDKIEVSPIPPLDLELNDEQNITLQVTFATSPEFPSTVKIGIVTATNKSPTSGLYNFVFQLIPPKGLQVKLLPPQTMELPPWKKRFLPPPIITQIALLVIPPLQDNFQPNVEFILSYSTDEDTALHNGSFRIPSLFLTQL